MKSLVLNLFLLKLKMMFDFTPDFLDKSFRIIGIFIKKNLKLSPDQSFYLVPIFLLVLVKTNLPIKKKDCK